MTNASLWWDTLPDDLRKADRVPLPTDTQCDVVIVGGGYTGLWTAYYLLVADPSIRVVIVEAKECGFGASGRNGGWCSSLFPASWSKLASNSSRSEAVRLQRTLFATVDEVGRVCRDEGIDAQYAKGGTIGVARTPLQVDRALDEIDSARAWGFDEGDFRWLDQLDAQRELGATGVMGGVFTPHTAAVNPARLVRGLALAVERRGGTIHENTRALRIEPGRVVTDHGTVTAPYVVRATEGYTSTIDGHRRDLAPVYSLMVATEPLPAEAWQSIGLHDRATFNDYRHLIIYGQRTADGRLAFGGRGAPYHFGSTIRPEFDRNPEVFAELRRVLVDLFPLVADAAITHTWGGPLGIPRDWFASVRLDRRTGMASAGGYVGDGVGTANLAGRTLADLIAGRTSDLTTLPWVGHRSPRWEPEPLRWIGTNVGLRVMASADDVEARTKRPARRAAVFHRFLGH